MRKRIPPKQLFIREKNIFTTCFQRKPHSFCLHFTNGFQIRSIILTFGVILQVWLTMFELLWVMSLADDETFVIQTSSRSITKLWIFRNLLSLFYHSLKKTKLHSKRWKRTFLYPNSFFPMCIVYWPSGGFKSPICIGSANYVTLRCKN